MKRNRGKEQKTVYHEKGTKKRRNKNDASQSLALPEQLSEHRRDLSENLSSSPSAATNPNLEPGVATDNELLLDDPNAELTPDLVDLVSLLNDELPSDDQAPSTAAAASNSKPHPKLADSGSVDKIDPLLADPHPLAAASSSVQLQSQQTEHQNLTTEDLLQFLCSEDTQLPPNLANSASVAEPQQPVAATSTSVQLQPEQQSLTSQGQLPEHLERSDILRLASDSATSSAPNNYIVKVTNQHSRTTSFVITDRNSFEEVQTEVTRRFNIARLPLLINEDTNAPNRGLVHDDNDLRNAIELATRSGSRLIQLKLYVFPDPYQLAGTISSVQLQSQQTEHQNLTRRGLLQEHVNLDRIKQLVLSNELSIHPHPVAAISTPVQLRPQQPERLSLTSGGPEHHDKSELHQLIYDSASSSTANNYTVEATDQHSRTIRFGITHTSSLEEVRTEVARRFSMLKLSFSMQSAASLVIMQNDNDLRNAIEQATHSGSRLIQLKVYNFTEPNALAGTSSSVQLQPQQTEHLSSIGGGVLPEYRNWAEQFLFSDDTEVPPNLANSASVAEKDDALSDPVAAASTSVQIQHQQPENLSLPSGGLLLQSSLDSASSSAPNNYTVEVTDQDSRTIRFGITDRSSLAEVETEVARRLEMGRIPFWMKNMDNNVTDLGVMLDDNDFSTAIDEARRSGSRLIRLEVYKFE